MAVNEQIVTGRKFRKLVDEATKLWQRISFWTKAVDVEFNDSKTAETKLGAIDGITDSLASTSSRIAASAKSVNQLSNDLGIATRPNPDDPTKAQWRPRGTDGEWKNFINGGEIQRFNFTASKNNQTFVITKPVSKPQALVVITSTSVTAHGDTPNVMGTVSFNVTASVANNVVTLSPTYADKGFSGGYALIKHSGYVTIIEGA